MNRSALAEVTTTEVQDTEMTFEKAALFLLKKSNAECADSISFRVSQSLDCELANGNMPA